MRTFIWKWARYPFLGLVVLLSLLALFFTLTPQGRTAFHTGLFVSEVLDVPLSPQSWFTPEPERMEVTYPQRNGTAVADIYRIPDNQERAAVLLFLGANAAGRDDADVVRVGNALARAGYVAMFHWSPTMALQYNADPDEIENLVWAFRYLRDRDYVDPDRVGMGGFCVGASFALVAAADPRIRDDVLFVNAFGPYYNASDLLIQAASRSYIYQGEIEPWDTDRLTLKVLANELIETLPDPRERELLSREYVEDQEVSQAALEGLSPEAQRVEQLITGTTVAEAKEIYQSLPPGFHGYMKRVSPSTYVEDIEARLMIMHDRDDRLVPSAESRRLVQSLEDRGNYRYTEMLLFDHVRPRSGGDLWLLVREGFKLYQHMYGIMRVAT